MAEIIFLCLAAILIVGFLVYSISSRRLGTSGSTTTVFMGAAYDMLNEDQRKAAEVLVEQKSGNKTEEQKSGESAD